MYKSLHPCSSVLTPLVFINDRENALGNTTFVNASWIWTSCCLAILSIWDSNGPKWICWGPWIAEYPKRQGTHTQHTQVYASNINRHITRYSCAELFSKSLSSWNQQAWVGISSNSPHGAFLRLCRSTRTRSGKWGSGMAHPVLNVSVPADSPLLLTLAPVHAFVYVTFRQKAGWSALGVLAEEKYKSDLTKGKRSLRHLHGN